MTMRNILVPAAHGLDLEAPLNAARDLARPLHAHLDVVYMAQSASEAVAAIWGNGLDLASVQAKLAETVEAQRARFLIWCEANKIGHDARDHVLGSTFARWREETQSLSAGVGQWGRLADLIVVNRPGPSTAQAARCFDAAVFAAGRPTLLVSSPTSDPPLRNVLVAWNGSLEATHAVAFCMDLLHAAEKVTIFSSKEGYEGLTTPPDLAASLRWHGIEAQAAASASSPSYPGEALLEAADACSASLILMGAYTHSRIRETYLGGVTRHVLRHATLPVVMTH